MKSLRRARLLILGAFLPLVILATALTAAAPASAAWPNPKPIPSIYSIQVHLGSNCSRGNLTAYGWGFANGEMLTVKFYEAGREFYESTATATNLPGSYGGWFAAPYNQPYPLMGYYMASVTEPNGNTFWATESAEC